MEIRNGRRDGRKTREKMAEKKAEQSIGVMIGWEGGMRNFLFRDSSASSWQC